MTEYNAGHIKRDPTTGAVAIRTIFPETDEHFIAMAWLMATPNIGARNTTTVAVEGWEDLYIAPPPEPAP